MKEARLLREGEKQKDGTRIYWEDKNGRDRDRRKYWEVRSQMSWKENEESREKRQKRTKVKRSKEWSNDKARWRWRRRRMLCIPTFVQLKHTLFWQPRPIIAPQSPKRMRQTTLTQWRQTIIDSSSDFCVRLISVQRSGSVTPPSLLSPPSSPLNTELVIHTSQ